MRQGFSPAWQEMLRDSVRGRKSEAGSRKPGSRPSLAALVSNAMNIFHRLAPIVVVFSTLAVSACAPPAPPSGYVPCAIERPALGAARLPTHLAGLPDTVDELFFPWPVGAGARPTLPSSDLAVRVRLKLDESGRVRDLCLLDPIDPRIARALDDRVQRGWLGVRPAVSPGQPGRPWIEDRVVRLRRAKPLSDVYANQPLSGMSVQELEEVALLAPVVRRTNGPRFPEFGRAALVELGRIGSAESLAAYDRVAAKTAGAIPAPVRLDALRVPEHGVGRPPIRWSVLGAATDPGGTTYRAMSGLLGGAYLARSATPGARDSWSRPVPAGVPVPCCFPPYAVASRNRAIELTCRACTDDGAPTTTAMRPEEVFRDRDGDGWTDIEERQLGLDPTRPDTDGDGVVDGADVCPTLPVSEAVDDEEARIVQAAFLASFGTPWPSPPLFPGATMPRVHFRGYAGPVLYGISAGEYATVRGTYLEWEVVNRRETSAVVLFGSRAPRSGPQVETKVYLRRHLGKWYAVAVDSSGWHVDGV